MTDSAMRELADDPSSRKRFFKMMGGAGAVSAFAVVLAACGDDDKDSASTSTPAEPAKDDGGKGDLAILNYALTLEYLEADFYKQVIDSGIVKDPKQISLAKQFGETEQTHVDSLKAAIEGMGGTAVTAPKTKFQPTLDKGLMAVLETAATVENLGAAAYLGAAGKIKSKDVLATALAIHSVEARHAAALNSLVGRGFGGKGGLEGSLPDGAFAKGMDEAAVLAAVKPFLA